MNAHIKFFIKKLPFVKFFIRLFIHPFIKTKKLSLEINTFFSSPFYLKNFSAIPKISNLIISLTSFPARMKFIEFTIFSLINQTVRPEKIILWLSEKEFLNKEKDIPSNLEKYFPLGLEIKFIKDNFKSYNKLIFSLKEYPLYNIITVDDDVFYKKTFIELLASTHKLYPNDIISNKVRRISFTNKILNPYLNWRSLHSSGISFLNFLLGYGGVLYPSNCLYKDVTNESLFLMLSPHADDIWFYVMALLKNTKIRKPRYIFRKTFPFDYQLTEEWQDIPELMKINWSNNKNDSQFKAVLDYYSLYDSFYNKYA